MDIREAIRARHSVRSYLNKPLGQGAIARLEEEIAACNAEGGLHIQLVLNEPHAFSGRMAKYGKFSGVTNYLALVGPKGPLLDELCGYYGERLVLCAQRLGLNTCWVALTYRKTDGAYKVREREKLSCVIAIGYGATQGVTRRSKPAGSVSRVEDGRPAPAWFVSGVEAALLAPTAMNQQKFEFVLRGDGCVEAKAGVGPYAKLDLGIVKYHFEIGAGRENFTWG